jgi:hypothetical protein
MTDLKQRLESLLALAYAATPVYVSPLGTAIGEHHVADGVTGQSLGRFLTRREADLYVASRSAVPALVKALQVALTTMETCMEEVMLPHQITHDELECSCNRAVSAIQKAQYEITALMAGEK